MRRLGFFSGRGREVIPQRHHTTARGGVRSEDMPKLKTHKTTAKRFKVTGSGKLRRRKVRATHLRRKKSKRMKQELRQDIPVSRADRKRVRRILGLKKR